MKFFLFTFATLLLCFSLVSDTFAQRRDYMTEEEIELIRNNQDIDKRIDVLTKMVDRRFTALGIDVGGWKQAEKNSSSWGALRTGTRTELLFDIRQILQKAIDDIDDVAMHNENTLTQNKTEGLLFPKAVRNLGASANRYLPHLRSMLDTTKDEKDRGLIIASIEHCEAIIEALGKLPPDPKQEKKKSKQ
ncbi:MAG TPA: hypothetical protein VFZ23_07500 [Pyrinomonadaceae bacterium]